MSGKNYSLIKSQYLKAIQNLTATIGEIKINVSEETQKEVKPMTYPQGKKKD